eukprot:60488-Pyramimonas_sp.AAC.1
MQPAPEQAVPPAASAKASTSKRLDSSALLSPPDPKAPRLSTSSPSGPILPISEQSISGEAASSSGPPQIQPAVDPDKTIEHPVEDPDQTIEYPVEDPDQTIEYPAEDPDNTIEYPADDPDKTVEYPAENSDPTKRDHYTANNF